MHDPLHKTLIRWSIRPTLLLQASRLRTPA
jgi:hypothetical protein